jgi:hypothetical integral membrane protein (TIGR02206 family)
MNLDTFRPYTIDHLVAVVVCAAMMAAPIVIGRRLRNAPPPRERAFRRILATGGLLFWIAYTLWWNWNYVDIERGLPLQICDIAGLIAPITLLVENRWFRATLYFWGLTLSLQGFIQPVLRVGPIDLEYWGFWTAHSIVVGGALYDLIVRRFRPMLADFGRATVTSLAYLAMIFPTNIILARVFDLPNVNYGYVADTKPENPTLIDVLGPWPWRVVFMVVIGFLGFGIAYVPWVISRRIFHKGDQQVHDRWR